MTHAEKLIAEVLELDAKATPGHWQKVSSLPVYAVCTQGEWGVWDVVTATGREYARHAHHEKHGSKSEDADLIAHYRTAAPKLAKALREALALIDMLHGFNVGVSFLSEERPSAQYAKLEEILKGEA